MNRQIACVLEFMIVRDRASLRALTQSRAIESSDLNPVAAALCGCGSGRSLCVSVRVLVVCVVRLLVSACVSVRVLVPVCVSVRVLVPACVSVRCCAVHRLGGRAHLLLESVGGADAGGAGGRRRPPRLPALGPTLATLLRLPTR